MTKIVKACTMLLILGTTVACAASKARIIVKAVDGETEEIIQGAKVKVWYQDIKSKGPGHGWGTITIPYHQVGKTDKKGLYDSSGETIESPRIYVDSDGYYQSRTTYKELTHSTLLNRWEPWPCEVTVKLRKIKDPVPMCLKTHDFFKVPEHGKKFGYDLKVGDLLAPHGKGKTADFYILVKKYQDEKKQWHFPVYFSFDRKGDGMQEIKVDANLQSTFVWPYMAPEKGFLQAMDMGSYIYGETTGLSTLKTKSYFVLRTRTRLDEKGNIISAHYTRFYQFGSTGNYLELSYAFNPNNKSRSLEFNGKNSFKDRDQYGRKLMSR